MSDRAAAAPQGTVDLSIAVLTFNEVQTLAATVAELAAVAAPAVGSYEILIIDDGSTDGSGRLADRLASERPEVRVVHHPQNAGLGEAYITGWTQARGNAITFFPADGQFPPEIVTDFVPLIKDADMVLGYLDKRDDPMLAKALSAAERLLFRLAFGSMPRFQGIFMLRRELALKTALSSRGRPWTVVLELILKLHAQRYRLVNRQISMRPRRHGRSKVRNLRTIALSLRELASLRLRMRASAR